MSFLVPSAIALVWIGGFFAAINPVDLSERYRGRKGREKFGYHPVMSPGAVNILVFVLLGLAFVGSLPVWSYNPPGDYRFCGTMGAMAFFAGLAVLCKGH